MSAGWKREYERLREAARQEAVLRRRAAEARCPELARIAQRRRDLLLAGTVDPEALARLAGREAELVRQLGLPPDAFAPRYRCALCADTGYAGDVVKQPCACRKRYTADPRPGVNDRETFEAYDPRVYADPRTREQMGLLHSYLERWAGQLPRPSPSTVLLMGSVGLGKTFFLNAVAWRAHQAGATVELLPAYRLMRRVLDSFERPSILDGLLALDLLCIDDLGVEPLMQNVTREYLFYILNERQAQGRATALATNLSNDRLQERYSERVFSRLSGGAKAIRLQGSDLRRLGKNPGHGA